MARKTVEPELRFFTKVIFDENTGCWLWDGYPTDQGYGRIYTPNKRPKMYRAHRFSYETFVGPIPEGMMVCHHCDVRNCVNPSHLYAGTAKDNARDMAVRGRHGKATLSQTDVVKMREEYLSGNTTYNELAEMFGVTPSNVRSALVGDHWDHVDTPTHVPRRNRLFSWEVEELIDMECTEMYTWEELAEYFNIGLKTVKRIIRKFDEDDFY